MDQVNDLVTAINTHAAWTAILGLALLALVQLARLPAVAALWIKVPVVYRPLVPVAIALLSAVGDALTNGVPWLPAVLSAIVAAIPALCLALASPVAHLDAFPAEAPTKPETPSSLHPPGA